MMHKNCNALDMVAYVLLLIGGLNWGLVGLFSFDLVATIFGNMSLISRIVYILVGVSAIYGIYRFATCCNKGNGNAAE